MLPGPPEKTTIIYPFSSIDGRAAFTRQRTGERVFDFNEEGVAHHGLYADWLEAVRLQPDSGRTLDLLFRSAEAYLRMWERAEATRGCSSGHR